ncbi:rRNA biogenesis protein rrp5 [Didymosphaeria variabile]|uniref:rRNA biogenesis protein RRP5 n=1 Tax=Didymosphaeria variabile TaxID=1932322 RepID=A0A9W8XS13_9PLEO|nr:rRNA biogenesis protein rrp5 [Didymosphaeria variabile]KAJ4356836.1 rRNA biogenesis protein rrp5 [Didymosphaeria variabile]
MGAIKRKADQGSTPAKKERSAPQDRSVKRQRKSDAAENPPPAKAKPEISTQKSIFKDEEKSFPRGGASVLTPLEHKQIQIRANQDVLFEQAGTKKRGGDDGLSDEGSDMGGGEDAPTKSKKRKSKKNKTALGEEEQVQKIKAEGLTFKNLAIGTLVLGQIIDVTAQDIALALPNGLVGYVPITAISDKLNERIEKLLKENEELEDVEDDEDDFEDVDLRTMFTVGQYLRACVTSLSEDAAPGEFTGKRKLELSIHPKAVNRGLVKSNVVENLMLQVSVISNEDHGLVMDLGLDEQNLKGFLGKKELGASIDHAKVQEGAVFLCLVSGVNPDGRIVKLLADQNQAGNLKKGHTLTDAPTIDVFLPGTAVELLITELSPNTIIGKVLGLVEATADTIHSGAAEKATDLTEKYNAGMKVKARIISVTEEDDVKKLGVSLVDHVLALSTRMSGKAKERKSPLDVVPLSSIVEEAKVTKVVPMLGVFFNIGPRDVAGFAPLNRLADERVEMPMEGSGPFQLASTHKARVIGFSAFDGMYRLSLEEKVISQPFLRIDEIKVGQVVKGKVQKLFADRDGSTALLVHLAEGINAAVSEIHLADTHLQHPERKFRENAPITARVLYVDVQKHQVRLTLKKSLVNSDVKPWSDYSQLSVGATGPGTLVNVKPAGALVHFYGSLRAWLPAAEMSEAYIQDATRHFTRGQVVNVRVISIKPEENRILVSCKDPAAVNADKETKFNELAIGDIVKGTVEEKGADSIIVDLEGGVKGTLRIGHLTDGSEKKDQATMARVRVGGPLDDLIVLQKHRKSRTVILSNKPSLRKDAQAQKLITKIEDIKAGATVHGFVRAIDPDKVFVEFANGVSGPIFKSSLLEDMLSKPIFGLRKDQSITARVSHVDMDKKRLWLSLKPAESVEPKKQLASSAIVAVNPVDENIKSTADIEFGTKLAVRVRSPKPTQINVRIADNVDGRIHISELFSSWDEIIDKKHPHLQFQTGQTLQVTTVGMHDAKNYRFLPISHRQGKNSIYELTTKNDIKGEDDLLTLEKIQKGDSFVAFVNNHNDRSVWVNVSATIRGRIDFFELTEDLNLLGDVEENFPVGSALRVRVKDIDVGKNRLDFTAVSSDSVKSLTLKDLKAGLILPARVTKLHESHIVVQINENVAGPIFLEQLADDYDQAKPSEFKVGDVIRVCVTHVDPANKKISLSARPSKVLSSSLPVKDPEIKSRNDLNVGQIVRGFIKRVDEKAIYVRLGPNVDAMVSVGHLSDQYVKNWREKFQVDQMVRGKITANDDQQRNPLMSLKKSVIEGDYVAPLNFQDIKKGQIVTATVRHVADYGVFLVIDKSRNVSGLCHVSKMADKGIEKGKVKDLYKEGDAVKAKVLTVNPTQRKVTFSLKYSDVAGKRDNEDEDMEDASDVSAEELGSADEEDDDDEDEDMRSVKSVEEDEVDDVDMEADSDDDDEYTIAKPATGLSTTGFDWTGATLDLDDQKAASDDESEDGASKKKRRHKKATIKEDRTGDLDAFGPQSVADYERLLLGQPNNAELWVRYMVFQRELNEIEKARQIARRALATMNQREEKERLDVWTALLHLENDFSSDDLIDETFKEACQNNDSREVHERMIKIYISSGKLDKADNLYQSMMKNKSFTPDPAFWLSYATFLFSTLKPSSPTRARALLSRATQSVPSSQHRYLTQKFAALEFKHGDPERGRTIFEGLVTTWPKKWDIWDVYAALELSHGGEENVRDIFERMSKADMKKRRADTVFKRWREWEVSKGGDAKRVDKAEREWIEKKAEKDEKDEE